MGSFFRIAGVLACAATWICAAESPEVLVKRLSDDSFRVRQEASKALWELGEAALPMLEKATNGSDPEAAHRARMLIDQIRLGVLPDTPPDVADLVRKYLAADENGKLGPIFALREKKAWRQILRLYAGEKAKGHLDENASEQLKRAVEGVAEQAAREALLASDVNKAVDYLLLAPSEDHERETALAALGRADADAAKRIEEAMRKEDAEAQKRWQLARALASGNLNAAEELAGKSRNAKVLATIRLGKGDPLPYIEGKWGEDELSDIHNLYRNGVVEMWTKGRVSDVTVRRLSTSVKQINEEADNAHYVVTALMLLGKEHEGETLLGKLNPLVAFLYYDSLDRTDDALKHIGLDPANPDYGKFAAEKLQHYLENPEEHSTDKEMLIALAGFLDRRGMQKEAKEVLLPLLKAEREKDAEMFIDTLTGFFNQESTDLGHLLVDEMVAYVGKDPLRWSEIYQAIFGERPAPNQWLQWLEKQGIKDPVERLRIVAGLFDLWRGEEKRKQAWLERAWQLAEKAEPAERQGIIRLLATYAIEAGDATTGTRALREMMAGKVDEDWQANYVFDLSAVGRFEEAGEIWKKWSESQPERPEFRAYYSACLRLSGKVAEADEQERWVEKLYLGETGIGCRIGLGFAALGDYARARMWWKRVIVETPPDERNWNDAVKLLAMESLNSGDWALAASLGEAQAWNEMMGGNIYNPQMLKLRYRLNVDMARGFDMISRDRKQGLEMLAKCAANHSMESLLPEHFFPGLAKVGLVEQQKAWGEESWKRQMAAVERFPNADNPKNSVAWLGARAGLHLDESEKLVKAAMEVRHDHPAYLDTLAEIWFSRGDRAKALEVSRRAISDRPTDSELRRQYEHFRQDPLPKL